MSIEALTRLNNLSTLFGRYGQTQGLQLPDSVKQLSSSAGIALAKAVESIQTESTATTSPASGVRLAFANLGSRFVNYLRLFSISCGSRKDFNIITEWIMT